MGMFSRAIAAAVDLPVELVVSLTATEIKKPSGPHRRLRDAAMNLTSSQDNETKLYEVAYEIIVPADMDIVEVMEKADRIAEPGSAESQLFRQVLLSTNSVAGVGKIMTKVPAHAVERKEPTGSTAAAPTEEDDGVNWVSVLVGAVAFILVVSCLVTTFVLAKRRLAKASA